MCAVVRFTVRDVRALQNVALERDEMALQYENIIKKNNNLKNNRDAADDNPEFRKAFEASMDTVISLVADRFRKMKLKEEPVTCPKVCEEQEVDAFFDILHQIDANICREKLTAGDLSKHKDYDAILKSQCCCYNVYVSNKKVCRSKLQLLFRQQLNFIPAPLLDRTKEHYKKFEEVYGSVPDEKDRPSMTFSKELTEEDNLHKEMLVSQKVRAIIKCAMCNNPRCIYVNAKLTGNIKANVDYLISEGEYACGGTFADDESYLRQSGIVRRQLTCGSQIETAYFSSKIALPTICCHCGGTSGAQVSDDEIIQGLKRKFSVVWPISTYCKDVVGLQPSTRGTKFDKAADAKKKK